MGQSVVRSCQKSFHWASKAKMSKLFLFGPSLWLIGHSDFMKEDIKKAFQAAAFHFSKLIADSSLRIELANR